MKRKSKQNWGLICFLTVLVLITATVLYGVANARVVRVVYGTAPLKNLDPRLDGLKILYVSDLKLSGEAEAVHAAKLIKKLCELKPDVLLIGGDISGESLLSKVSVGLGLKSGDDAQKQKRAARDRFLLEMNNVSVPWGIFAVFGDEDITLSPEDSRRSNINFLNDSFARLNINGAYLPIYGLSGKNSVDFKNAGVGAAIVMFHEPRIYKAVALKALEQNAEPGSFLFLSAHILGGQVRLGGRFLAYEKENGQYTVNADEYGIYSDESGVKMLVSSGVGSEKLPFRIGSAPRAYLITLKSE